MICSDFFAMEEMSVWNNESRAEENTIEDMEVHKGFTSETNFNSLSIVAIANKLSWSDKFSLSHVSPWTKAALNCPAAWKEFVVPPEIVCSIPTDVMRKLEEMNQCVRILSLRGMPSWVDQKACLMCTAVTTLDIRESEFSLENLLVMVPEMKQLKRLSLSEKSCQWTFLDCVCPSSLDHLVFSCTKPEQIKKPFSRISSDMITQHSLWSGFSKSFKKSFEPDESDESFKPRRWRFRDDMTSLNFAVICSETVDENKIPELFGSSAAEAFVQDLTMSVFSSTEQFPRFCTKVSDSMHHHNDVNVQVRVSDFVSPCVLSHNWLSKMAEVMTVEPSRHQYQLNNIFSKIEHMTLDGMGSEQTLELAPKLKSLKVLCLFENIDNVVRKVKQHCAELTDLFLPCVNCIDRQQVLADIFSQKHLKNLTSCLCFLSFLSAGSETIEKICCFCHTAPVVDFDGFERFPNLSVLEVNADCRQHGKTVIDCSLLESCRALKKLSLWCKCKCSFRKSDDVCERCKAKSMSQQAIMFLTSPSIARLKSLTVNGCFSFSDIFKHLVPPGEKNENLKQLEIHLHDTLSEETKKQWKNVVVGCSRLESYSVEVCTDDGERETVSCKNTHVMF